MKYSAFLNLNYQDLIRGAIMAAGGAGFAIIQGALSAGNFQIDWTNVLHMAAGAALVYLAKNLFTPEPKTIEIDPEKTTVIEKPL